MSNCRGAWKKQSLEKYNFTGADKALQILICDVASLVIWVPCVIEVPHGVFLLFVAGSKCVLAGTVAQSIAICVGDSNFKAGYKTKQVQGPLLIYRYIHVQ